MFNTGNALEDGLVSNLARPGGNLTGVSQVALETTIKAYQLLREMAPDAAAIALVSVANPPGSLVQRTQEIEMSQHLRPPVFAADSPADQEAVYAELARSKSAAVVLANARFTTRMVELAARYRVPAVYGQRSFVEAGGLMSYGASVPTVYLIKGLYAGRILKGAKPGDLPVQQPSRFELALNLRTAQELALKVPQTILLAADEVIE